MASAGSVHFEDYVSQRRPALMRFATVLTGQPWLADDIVSDVLGRAFERWDRVGTVADPHAYVRRMIVNDYLSWRRRLSRTAPYESLESHLEGETASPGPAGRGPIDPTDEHAERDAMLQRLTRLPRRQRAAVALRYYVGLPDAEIAEYLGCRAPTVRSQIARALQTLRVQTDRPSVANAAAMTSEGLR